MWVVPRPHRFRCRSRSSSVEYSSGSDGGTAAAETVSMVVARRGSRRAFYERARLRSPHRHHAGFTIVELLIVIVVIGILAAITIVAYAGIQNRAKASSAQSAASQALKKVAAWSVQNSDTYPASLADAGISDSGGTTYQYRVDNAASPRTFCVTATTQNVSYWASNAITTPSAGACAGHGENGGPVITNLHPNPRVSVNANGWNVSGTVGSTGVQTLEPAGGPTGVDTFYRRTISSSPNASPMAFITTGSGVSGIPVPPSTTFRISAYFRCSFALSTGFRIDVNEYDSSGATIGATSSGPTTPTIINQWQQLSRTFTTSATASYMRVMLAFSGPQGAPPGSTFDVTGMMVTAGSTSYTYADGDTPGWAWDGATGNSSSTGPPL